MLGLGPPPDKLAAYTLDLLTYVKFGPVEVDQVPGERFAVELAHLGEHVGLLDPLDDVPVVDADVVELDHGDRAAAHDPEGAGRRPRDRPDHGGPAGGPRHGPARCRRCC